TGRPGRGKVYTECSKFPPQLFATSDRPAARGFALPRTRDERSGVVANVGHLQFGAPVKGKSVRMSIRGRICQADGCATVLSAHKRNLAGSFAAHRGAERNTCMSQSFPDLGVSAPVVKALAARGITNPFPIQGLIMADALAGRDVLAKSQTGSGKTLAFAIPIV